MDHILIYNNIIQRAKTRNLNGYKERHHIIPKCIGGDNDNSNLVYLTAKEHYICHHLLIHIYPNVIELYHAFWMMSNRFKINSRDYEEARTKIASQMRKNVGTKEAITKMSKSRKGQRLWLGKKHKESSKKKMSLSAKNRKKEPASKIILQFDIEGNFIKEWKNITSAAKALSISVSGITTCAKGRQKTAAGFKWKYK